MKWLGPIVLMTLFPVVASASQVAIPLTPKMMDAARSAVAREMRDSASARFGPWMKGFQNSDGSIDVCGEVNGTNAFGGYTGMTPFHVSLIEIGSQRKNKRPTWFGAASSINRRVFVMYPVCDPTNWK